MKTLVPFDGSPAAVRAVQLAIEQARSQPTRSFVVLNVQNLATQDLPEGAGIMPPGWITEQEGQAGSEILTELKLSARRPERRMKRVWKLAQSPPRSSA